jgi:hypothetical protein
VHISKVKLFPSFHYLMFSQRCFLNHIS